MIGLNRKGGILFILLGLVVLVGAGVIAGDFLLQQNFGIGVFDVIRFVLESGNTRQTALSISEANASELGEETYNRLISDKEELESIFEEASDNLSVINENENITKAIMQAVGGNFSAYLFSIYTLDTPVGSKSYKVFEWSVRAENGKITTFKEGEVFSAYDAVVEVDHSVVQALLDGTYTQDDLLQWVKESKIKVNPVTQVLSVINIIPLITENLHTTV